jgi:hypothetical protein
MLNRINKKFQAGVLVCGAVLLTHNAFAQTQLPGNIMAELKKLLEDQSAGEEEVQRALMQDMKNFMGLTELKRVETQNVMRLMLPPYFDTTMTLGERVFAAEETIIPWQKTLVQDTANYNMNTPETASDETAFLTPLMEEGPDAMLDPYLGGLDQLLASTLLNGYAFENDAQAEKAYQYIKLATNFTPIKAKTKSELFNDDGTFKDGTGDYFMSLYKQLVTMSMAQNSMLAIHAQKQRFVGLGENLPIGDQTNKSASLMEVMAYEVERRYMSPAWYAAMNQMSTEGLLREISNMLAFQTYLGFKQYEQTQRTEAMIATQMGVVSGMLNVGEVPSTEEVIEGL